MRRRTKFLQYVVAQSVGIALTGLCRFDNLVCEYFIGPDQKPCGAANPWKTLVLEEFMIRTPICDLLDIEHPIALGGMGSATSPALVAAVSRAGGLGALGCHYLTPNQIQERAAAIRQETKKPFGLNFLTFDTREDSFAAALELRPSVMQFAWARPDQDLKPYFDRSHDAGCKVTYMAGAVPEALRAAKAGADIIIAQGTEGGGHVGWMASMPLIPMIVDAVAPIPVLAAGGFADGRGLVAALALGAEGILLGTRFLATVESPLHANFKQAIVDSDGHDTQLSEIPDIAAGLVWPGAMTRSRRNRFVERWAGREWPCGKAGRKPSPDCERLESQATSMKARCRWDRMRASFTTSRAPRILSPESRKRRKRYLRANFHGSLHRRDDERRAHRESRIATATNGTTAPRAILRTLPAANRGTRRKIIEKRSATRTMTGYGMEEGHASARPHGCRGCANALAWRAALPSGLKCSSSTTMSSSESPTSC